MKKFYSLIMIMAAVACCSMFTSCTDDEDVAISRTLYGEWTGNFGMYYTTIDPYGQEVSFDSYDTDIEFIQSGPYDSYGTGYQVDYYQYGPYERISHKFNWSVSPSGVITITYPRDPDYNTSIHDYTLSDSYFSGYFSNATQPFRLKKLVDYNWSSYYAYDYYEWPYISFSWDDYYYDYYAKGVNEPDELPSMKKAPKINTFDGKNYDPKNPPIIKKGNRFNENK